MSAHMSTRVQVASTEEGMPQVAWVLMGVAALVTLIRIILTLTGQDNGIFESLQVLLIFLALIYVLAINFPRFRAALPTKAPPAVLPTDPPLAQFFSSSPGSSTFWFTVRMYLGYTWLTAGIEKFMSPAWRSGAALKGFWTAAVAPPADPAHPTVAFEWYRNLLSFMLNNGWYSWFNWVIMFGETLIGIGLLVGGLTGIAALFGALLNFSFGLAGSAGVNPLLLVLAILVVWAWKVAGYYGLDRLLLPGLGTFYQPGIIFQRRQARPQTGRAAQT
jgi:thiosulfate dehydrogenase (quinone) large subunit